MTPRLANWAKRADVYERVWAVDSWTLPTHAALFTGRYPVEGGRHLGYEALRAEDETIAEILAARGYATLALTDGILMTPHYGIDQGFDRFVARYEPLRTKLVEAEAAIAELVETGAPYFALVHTYAVHEPYSMPADPERLAKLFANARGGAPIGTRSLFRLTGQLADELRYRLPTAEPWIRALYDAALDRADDVVGGFLEDLEANGLLDQTVVVVTSDHGEELFDHGALGHGYQLPRPELVQVPLIIRQPGQREGARLPEPLAQPAITNLLLEAIGSVSG